MKNLKYRPMAVIGFAALILIFVSVVTDFIFGCGVIYLAVGAVLTVILISTKEIKNYTVIAYICAAMIFSGVILMSNSVFSRDAALKYAGDECNVCAVVTDDMSVYNNSNAYVLKTESVNGEKVSAKILVYSKTSFPYKPGDVITFNSKITDNISERDFLSGLSYVAEEEYLYSFITDDSSLALKESGDKTLQRYLYLIRNEIKQHVFSFLPGEEGTVTVGMLTGDKSSVSFDTIDIFRRAGISHLFAVSGLHLSVWVMSLYTVLKNIARKRRLSEILSIVFTVFFMALTGFTPSVCRAGIMLVIILLARIFDEDGDSLNSLGLSAFVILAVNPMAAVSVSLLLSFSATLGIITVYPAVERKIYELTSYIKNKTVRRFYKYVFSLAALSVCATLFTLPVSAFFIGDFSVAAPVTNVFVSLAATAQMIFGGLSAIFFPIMFIARPCAFICGILAKYVIFVSSFLADIPLCVVETDSVYFRLSLIVIISLIISVTLLVYERKKRVVLIVSSVLCVSLISTSLFALFNYGKTNVTVFNTDGGFLIQIKHDGYKLIAGCGGKENYPEDYVSSRLVTDADLLLIPDRSRQSSSMFMYCIDFCAPERVISGQKNFSVEQMFEECEVSDCFCLNPWLGAYMEFCNDGGNSYLYLYSQQGSVLIVYKLSESYSIPVKYYDADVLIMYPENSDKFSYEKFGCVITNSEGFTGKNIYKINDCDFISFDLNKNNTEIICSRG